MQTFSLMPRRTAVWFALALGGLMLQGCAEQSSPQGPQPRLFASDFQGAAKSCTAPKPRLAAGKETIAAMKLDNDGGWCAISVANDGAPYAAGLLTQPPRHGKVYVHPVGAATRIDYTPDRGFAGDDAFVVRLLPDNPSLRVNVAVAR